MKRMACVLALATSTGLALGVNARPALAGPTAVVADGFQISLAATSAVVDDSSVALEVKYRGGNVDGIELFIDGTQVKKQTIHTPKASGKIRFEVDPGLMSEGDHDVMIQATDAEGHVATATAHLHVAPAGPVGLARLLSPKRNATVQGIVPIEIKLDETVHQPFVSFFVDEDFAVVNFAPFTYNWDSTRATNGPHTIRVEVMDGETQAIVRRFNFQIMVNNPGGLTARQGAIKDLNAPVKQSKGPAGQIVETARAAAKPSQPVAKFDPSGLDTRFVTEVRRTTELPGTPHDSLPQTDLVLREHTAAVSRPDHTPPPTHFIPVVTAPRRPGIPGVFANPHELLQLDHSGLNTPAAPHTRLRSRRIGNIAALPQEALTVPNVSVSVNPPSKSGVSISVNPPAKSGVSISVNPQRRPEVSSPINTHSKATLTLRRTQPNRPVIVSGGAFDVAFDSSRIAFDVPPRVEHGLPLAPFRQIFEHTGGTVKWYGQSHTVRAYNATREIEFKVGTTSAKVNNQNVKMDVKSYIDRGRTIVPLTFVRDALNVKVQYDPTTGHLRIESRH